MSHIQNKSNETEAYFISGDCNEKAIVWKLNREKCECDKATEEEKSHNNGWKYRTEEVKQLEGHTETVEYAKFNYDGKLMVTGGMNNKLRIWDVENDMALKSTIEDLPENLDINFVEWHPKGNLIMAGVSGSDDYLIWLFNG